MLKFEVSNDVTIADGQLIDGVSLYLHDYDEGTYVLKDTITDFMGSVVNDEAGLGEYVVIDFTILASPDEYDIERICLKSGNTEIAVSGDTYISKEAGKNLKVRLSAQFDGASKCRFERTSINLPYATPYREGVVRFVSCTDYYDPDPEDNNEDNNIKSHLVYSAADVDEKISDTVTDIDDRFVSWDIDSDNVPMPGKLTVSQLTIESDISNTCAAILTCTTTSDFGTNDFDGSLDISLNGLYSASEASADVNSYLRGNFILSDYVADSCTENGWFTDRNRDKIPTVHTVDYAIKDAASDLQKQIDGINAGQNLADIVDTRTDLSAYNISNLKANGDEYAVQTGNNEYEYHTFTVGDKIQVLRDTWDNSANEDADGENPGLGGVGTIYELVKVLPDDDEADARDIIVNKSGDNENPDLYRWHYVGPYGVNGNEYVKLQSDTAQQINSDLNINGDVTIKNVTISENNITSKTTGSDGVRSEFSIDKSGDQLKLSINSISNVDNNSEQRHASITLDSNYNTFKISLNDEAPNHALKINKPDSSGDFYSVTGDAVADYSAIEENTPTSYTDGRLVTVDYMQDAITKNTPTSQPLDILSSVNADYSVGLFLYTKPGDDLPIGSIIAGADLRPVGLTLPLSGQISYKSLANNNTYTGQWKLLSMAVKRTDTEPCLVLAQKCVVVLEPLNFTARAENSSVTLNKEGELTASYKYSLDNQTWSNYTFGEEISLANIGDRVYFKGHRSNQGVGNYLYFTMTGTVAASGNVNSLLDENNYNTITDLSEYGDDTFFNMFRDCTALISAPELPATTLAKECYRYMFCRCTSLEVAPALPATTLANSCYDTMFYICTSLETAPELPAATLVDSCYMRMFGGCTLLNEVKCYATDISASYATSEWLENVSSGGTFYKAVGVTWPQNANGITNGIPSGWDVEDI